MQLQGPDIPFEQLLQHKQEGGNLPKGPKARIGPHSPSHRSSKAAQQDFKRQNKNRPVEQSSKRPVPRHRQVVELRNRHVFHATQLIGPMSCSQSLHYVSTGTQRWCLACSESRDPRFENLSGKFSTDQFRKQYAFVYDESLPQEKQELRQQMQVLSQL